MQPYQGSAGSAPPKAKISGYNSAQVAKYTPGQQAISNKLVNGVGGGQGIEQMLQFIQSLASGDESMFQNLEAPAHRNFDQAIGQLGSRFAMNDALGSSAFQNAAAGAAGNLGQDLASQRYGMQQQGISQLMQLIQSILGEQPYEQVFKEKPRDSTKSDIFGLLGAVGPQLLKMAPMAFGAPPVPIP